MSGPDPRTYEEYLLGLDTVRRWSDTIRNEKALLDKARAELTAEQARLAASDRAVRGGIESELHQARQQLRIAVARVCEKEHSLHTLKLQLEDQFRQHEDLQNLHTAVYRENVELKRQLSEFKTRFYLNVIDSIKPIQLVHPGVIHHTVTQTPW